MTTEMPDDDMSCSMPEAFSRAAQELDRLVKLETQMAYIMAEQLAVLQKGFNPSSTYKSFSEFVEAEYEIPADHAEQLIRIHKKIDQCNITLDDIAGIHWTKFRAVIPALTAATKMQWLPVARRWSVRSKQKEKAFKRLRDELCTTGKNKSSRQVA